MIATIHQPHFMPWLGYLHRMAQADLFVLLDHVQFERANYQNRLRVLVDGEPRWLTVPVLQRSQKERILDKEIDRTRRWGTACFSTLRHAYRQAPYFDLYAAELRAILEHPWTRLVDLNAATLQFLRSAFGIHTSLVKSSSLDARGAKSELVLGLCKEVGAGAFLGGLGGSRSYLDTAAFRRAGVEVRWQEFRHPRYPQRGAQSFVPGLSSLDLLFNCGPRAREVLLATEEKSLLAA